jgi:autotransporter-associated beta strand protein
MSFNRCLMNLKSAWRNLLGTPAQRRRNSFTRHDLCPAMEVLEDRLLLATVTWNSLQFNPLNDGKWSNPNNWAEGRAPQDNDDLVFPYHPIGQIFFQDHLHNDLNDLRVRSITASALHFIFGNPIKLGEGGIRILDSPNFTNDLLLLLNIELTTAATPTLIDSVADTSILLEGVSGVGGLTKGGDGELFLQNGNSYIGPTNVLRGVVHLQGGESTLGATGPGNETFVSSGAVLDLQTDIGNETLQLEGATAGGLGAGALNFSHLFGSTTSTSASWAGPINLTGSTEPGTVNTTAITVQSGRELTLSGKITGIGGIQKGGAGKLILANDNDYAGLTRVSNGVLTIGNPSALGSTVTGTLVTSGAALELRSSPGVGFSTGLESLMLNGSGIGSQGALLNVAGNHVWGGSITLESASTIGSTNNTLTVEGIIDNGGKLLTVTGLGNTIFGGSGILEGDGGLTKTGPGTLSLSGFGNNIYRGITTVSAGVLILEKPSALGSTVGNTIVAGNGAALVLSGGFTFNAEPLTLNGTGVGNTGAIRNATGNNTWTGNIIMDSFSSIDVGTGSLTMNGTITGLAGLMKLGLGSLIFGGNQSNSFTGTLTVSAGFLFLDKSSGIAVPGALVIGNNGVNFNFALVQLVRSNQISDSSAVTINSSAQLDLQSHDDAIRTLTLIGGRVSTGTGILQLNGDVIASSDLLGTSAVIEGNLGLGGNTRTFTVFSGSAAVDLLITAKISAQAGIGLIKAGTDTLRLTGNNTYSGQTIVNAGRLQVDGSQPSSFVVVNAGASLGGLGRIGTLTVNGNGTLDPGTGATLVVTGDVTLAKSSTLVVRPISTVPSGFTVTGKVNLGSANFVIGLVPFVDSLLPPLGAAIPLIVDPPGAISGTFTGLANNAIVSASYPTGTILFRINYLPTIVLLTRISGPAFQNRTVTPTINEGEFATVTGTITTADPKDTFFLDVDWGDGTPMQTITVKSHEPRLLSVTHRYLDDDPSGTPTDNYTISLLWRDQRGAQNTGALVVTVNNVAPTLFAGGNASVHTNSTFAQAGFLVDPGSLDQWTATVDYGDGSGIQILRLNPAHRFLLNHRYEKAGEYQVILTIQDDRWTKRTCCVCYAIGWGSQPKTIA